MAKYTASFCVSYRPEDGADGADGPTYTFSPTSVTLSATTDDDGYPTGALDSYTLTVNTDFLAYGNDGNQVTISGVSLLGNTNCDSSSVSSTKIVIVPDTREVTYPDATDEEKSYTYDLAYSSGEILLAVTIGDDVFNVTIAWTGDVSLTTGGLSWNKAMLESVYAQVTENTENISTISQTATEISASVSTLEDTVDGQAKNIATISETANTISASVSTLEDTVDGQADSISSLTVTANEISASVSTLESGLKACGIDITTGRITLTANSLMAQNQSGQTTFTVGEYGDMYFYGYDDTDAESIDGATRCLSLTSSGFRIVYGNAYIVMEIRNGEPILYGYNEDGERTMMLPETAQVVTFTITYVQAAYDETLSPTFSVNYSMMVAVYNDTAAATTFTDDTITAYCTELGTGDAVTLSLSSSVTVAAGGSGSLTFLMQSVSVTVDEDATEKVTEGVSTFYVEYEGTIVATAQATAEAQ